MWHFMGLKHTLTSPTYFRGFKTTNPQNLRPGVKCHGKIQASGDGIPQPGRLDKKEIWLYQKVKSWRLQSFRHNVSSAIFLLGPHAVAQYRYKDRNFKTFSKKLFLSFGAPWRFCGRRNCGCCGDLNKALNISIGHTDRQTDRDFISMSRFKLLQCTAILTRSRKLAFKPA